MSPTSRLSDELLDVARDRLSGSIHSEANLRRATSDLYYAVFHAVSEALVEPLVGHTSGEPFKEAYVSIYRQLDHGLAEKRCKIVAQGKELPEEIRRFAKHMTSMKEKRVQADYHPLETMQVSVVKNDLQMTEARLKSFWEAPPGDRTAFAYFVGLKNQRD